MTAAAIEIAPIRRIDRWFTASEPDAAGRMGLFRIIYAVIYLWHLSIFDAALIHGMPWLYRTPMAVTAALPLDPPPGYYHAIEAVMVAALVLIAVGWRVRPALAALLVAGVVREAYLASVAVEDSNVFIVFYVPLFMLLAGPCDQTYSLGAWLDRRAGRATVDPSDGGGRWFLPARATLVMLAALFVSSVLFKCFSGGTWLRDPHVLLGVMLERNVKSSVFGLWPHPMTPWFAGRPAAAAALQWGVLAFEGSFFLALLHRGLRDLYIAAALLFHAGNTMFLVVSFTPILAAYAMFVNWEAVRRTLHIRLVAPAWADRVPPAAAVAGVVVIAAALAATWHLGSSAIFNLGGLIHWQTPWFVVAPLAVLWAGITVVGIIRRPGAVAPAAAA